MVAASDGPVIAAGSVVDFDQIRAAGRGRRLGLHDRQRDLRGQAAGRPRRRRAGPRGARGLGRERLGGGGGMRQRASPRSRGCATSCSPSCSTAPTRAASSCPTRTSWRSGSGSAGRPCAKPSAAWSRPATWPAGTAPAPTSPGRCRAATRSTRSVSYLSMIREAGMTPGLVVLDQSDTPASDDEAEALRARRSASRCWRSNGSAPPTGARSSTRSTGCRCSYARPRSAGARRLALPACWRRAGTASHGASARCCRWSPSSASPSCSRSSPARPSCTSTRSTSTATGTRSCSRPSGTSPTPSRCTSTAGPRRDAVEPRCER